MPLNKKVSHHGRMARLSAATALALGFTASGASAQAVNAAAPAGIAPTEPAAADNAQVGEIVVTASRTRATGFSAPTPTTVVSAENLARRQVINVGDALNELPSFKATNSAATASIRSQGPGSVQADLRGLGAPRTLVLVNGIRPIPLATSNHAGFGISPDLNSIPTAMIERVEVVTGGASAQWGSDAVAGVVNFILRKKYKGIEVTGQTGISELGDSANYRIGLVAGTSFSGGRGNIIASFDASDSKAFDGYATRDWGRKNYQIVANPCVSNPPWPATCPAGAAQQPRNILSPDVQVTLSRGGLITGVRNGATAITGSAVVGQEIQPNGTLAPFQFGQYAGGTYMIGGKSYMLGSDSTVIAPVKRGAGYLYTDYDLGGTTLFAEANVAESVGTTHILPARDSALSISLNNPFLPAAVRAAILAASPTATSFTMNRVYFDQGTLQVVVKNHNYRGAVGARGSFGDSWDWDANLGLGRNEYRQTGHNNQIRARNAFAVNAVRDPASGQIVCAATVVGSAAYNPSAAGCVPINVFGDGAGATNPAALAYVNGESKARDDYTQRTAAANLRGKPFSTWAGPVSVAAGLEYRRESENSVADPISNAGGYQGANATTYSGNFNVKEGYFEATVPLARDVAFAQELNVDGAVRYADYSTVGSQTTWKVGAQWEPLDGLSFRLARSRDIRAPALYELFSPGSVTTNNVNNLVINGVTYSRSDLPGNFSVGNPNLRAEKADTLTLGAVARPVFLPGFSASVDYYDIDLKGAITSYAAANVVSNCNAGDQTFCNYFTIANGQLQSVNVGVQNLASVRNKGVEIVLSYKTPLDSVGLPGALRFDVNGTYVTKVAVNNGLGSIVDRSGEITSTYSLPRFRMMALTTWDLGRLQVSAQVNHIDANALDNTYNTLATNTININRVPARTYLNLRGSYDITSKMQVFAGVSNVFDKDPPPVPNANQFTPVSGLYYDLVGRAFTFGIRLRT